MKVAAGYLPAAISTAFSIAAFVLLCIRTHARNRAGRAADSGVPVWVSICRWPALLLAPAVSELVPAAYERRLLRLLDSNDLHPQLTPALWIASRVVHGAAAAGVGLALAGADSPAMIVLAGVAGYMVGGLWLRHLNLERERQIARELPAYLDLLTVCVEAGATLTAGVRLIVAQAPTSPLRSYFDRVLREVRGGRPRAQAFAHVAGIHDVESLTTLANALSHAEGAGMSLGQILRTQSEQRTAERFARAERLAMQAPVKMLGPLIFCIFPCTFIVLAVPIVVRLMEAFRT
ncbi:MAG: type II secretion system F family protein [Steroidobacteraceae bacterium]